MAIIYPEENDVTSVMTNTGTRWLAALVASALVLALMIGGDQPSAQAIGPGETDIAYVADGYNFPDALMGATLAALNNAPMLGVRSPSTGDVVPPETAEELDRLTNDKANKLDTIYVFGGPFAVSDKVVNDLKAWATNVERIFGDNRFGTMQAISEMLPTKAKDSDLLDGKDSSDFLGASEKSADSDLLDGKDSTAFLGAAQKATDSDQLDGQDSSAFAAAGSPFFFAHGYTSSTNVPSDGTDTVLVDVSISLDDPCGGGTTQHTLVANAVTNVRASGATSQVPRMGIALDSSSLFFGEGFAYTEQDGGPASDEGNLASQRVLEAVGPGNHNVRLVADTAVGDVTVPHDDSSLTVMGAGWTCP